MVCIHPKGWCLYELTSSAASLLTPTHTTDFYTDRDQRGRPSEYLTIEFYRAYGLEAYINDAPEDDYKGSSSHDTVVEGVLHDVKTDFIAARTKRIFVERASLEHTESSYFDYWMLTPYGFDVRVFTRAQLIGYYNAKNRVRRGDGTFFETYRYAHGIAGDQAGNDGVFVPMEVVKTDGLAPWEAVRLLTKQTA